MSCYLLTTYWLIPYFLVELFNPLIGTFSITASSSLLINRTTNTLDSQFLCTCSNEIYICAFNLRIDLSFTGCCAEIVGISGLPGKVKNYLEASVMQTANKGSS